MAFDRLARTIHDSVELRRKSLTSFGLRDLWMKQTAPVGVPALAGLDHEKAA